MVYMHARRFRPLSDLNLIDNFLFHKMIDDKEAGEEFCRILLRTILNKEIRHIKITPQRSSMVWIRTCTESAWTLIRKTLAEVVP